jgi:hypothetical protein
MKESSLSVTAAVEHAASLFNWRHFRRRYIMLKPRSVIPLW